MTFHGKRTNPKAPDPCHICHEDTFQLAGEWFHDHTGEAGCGTGDGSTAYPESLWTIHEAARVAREGVKPGN